MSATHNRTDAAATGHGFMFYDPTRHPPEGGPPPKISVEISHLREQSRGIRDAKRDLRGINTITCRQHSHWFGPSFVQTATMSDLSDAEESAESVHPWPYLSDMFAYKSKAGNSVKLICLLCAPKRKELSAFVTSTSNLRKHVKV